MESLTLILFICSLQILNVTSDFQGKFWHICDIHLNSSYKSNENNRYGNYNDDTTFSLFQSTVQQMKNIDSNPSFIIVNGDNSYHGEIYDSQLNESLNIVVNELQLYFPSTIILPSLGNHDVNPANLLSPNSTWCQNFYNCWKIVLHNVSDSDIRTFKIGCYYTYSIERYNSTLMVIVLNTLLWYNINVLVNVSSDPLDQFLWLENKLSIARINMTKVFLVAHVPPGASEASPERFQHLHPSFNQRFLKIMQNYSDIIDAGFFAHQHTDAFKIVYNANHEPVIPLLLSPSVTPYNLWGLGSINPSVRLYMWNGTSARSKYMQYHTLIPSGKLVTNSSSVNWMLEYDSTTLLQNLSAKSLNALVSHFSQPNSQSFQSFFSYHLSGQKHDIEACSVNSLCRCRIICGIKHINYTTLDFCLKKCPISEKLAWIIIPIIISILIIFLFLFYIFRFYSVKRNKNPRYESF